MLCYAPGVDEVRKRTILIAASVLVSRKWAQLEGKPSPALDSAIADAISLAERIMQKIDNRTANPHPPNQSMTSAAGYLWKSRLPGQRLLRGSLFRIVSALSRRRQLGRTDHLPYPAASPSRFKLLLLRSCCYS